MNANSTTVSGPVFQGRYVKSIEAVLAASLVSGQNVMLISPPGSGKTSIALSAAKSVFNEEEVVVIRFDPTTGTNAVLGNVDVGGLISPPYEYRINTKGSAYDPMAKVVLLDETHRCSDPAGDALLKALDRVDLAPDSAPVCWGTSNFINKSERAQAMIDRFAFNVWFKADPTDIEAFVQNYLSDGQLGLRARLQNGMPTREKIEWAKKVVFGAQAIKAVAQFMGDLWAKAETGLEDSDGKIVRSFAHTLNYRRRVQWLNIIARYSALLTEDNNFAKVPNAVGEVMAFANIFTSYDEALDWAKLIGEAVDPVQAAIQQMAVEVYAKLQHVQKIERDGQLAHLDAVMEVTRIMGEGLMRIQMVANQNGVPDDDDGLKTQIQYIQDAVAAFGRGEEI